MQYEVEVKYHLNDPEAFRALILEKNATIAGTFNQEDIYLGHPSRDFSKTDEAFRIRKVGSENRLTYKGPLVDQTTKTRQEVEVKFATDSEATDAMLTMMKQLGFNPLPAIYKIREAYHFAYEEFDFEIVIDNVRNLGWFVELECCVDENQQEVARKVILKLAEFLGLGPEVERRSYLRLLLEKAP